MVAGRVGVDGSGCYGVYLSLEFWELLFVFLKWFCVLFFIFRLNAFFVGGGGRRE